MNSVIKSEFFLLKLQEFVELEELKIVAAVCKTWKNAFENPRVMAPKFAQRAEELRIITMIEAAWSGAENTANRIEREGRFKFYNLLSIRQISILFASNIKGVDGNLWANYLLSGKDLQQTPLSPLTVEKLLNSYEEAQEIPDAQTPYQALSFKWVEHFLKIHGLSRSCHQSTKFQLDALIAIFSRHIKFMQTQGFDIEAELNAQAITPLGIAARWLDCALLEALVRCGASLNRNSSRFKKPLYHLIYETSKVRIREEGENLEVKADESIRTLVKLGTNPDEPFLTGGFTALWYAAHRGKYKLVKSLLDVGADINHHAPHFWSNASTPLQAAAYAGHLPVVEMLVLRGADPLRQNEQQQTAAQLARKARHFQIANYLDLIVERRMGKDKNRYSHCAFKTLFLASFVFLALSIYWGKARGVVSPSSPYNP